MPRATPSPSRGTPPLSPHARVAEASHAFESRWTMSALRNADLELYERFRAQQDDWHAAMFSGVGVEEQTSAMVRAWAAVTAALERRVVADDAYLIGRCPRTGTAVAIGDQAASRQRVRQLHGEAVLWVTPDEVAVLLGSERVVAGLKEMFPGSELIGLVPNE